MPTDDYFAGPGPEKRYYDYLAEGKFMIQRSKSSGNYVHYPRVMEPGTGAADLEWVEASGDGVVYATTVNRHICLIDLAEGPRMMSRVVGIAPTEVKIGMKVKAKVDKIGDHDAVVFEPAE